MEVEKKAFKSLSDLHIYILPVDKWIPYRRLARNQVADETISLGFVRVAPDTTLSQLRILLQASLPQELPEKYVFVKSVGQNFTRVKAHQEGIVKVKNFLPPHALEPEIHVLELTDEIQRHPSLLPSDSEFSEGPHLSVTRLEEDTGGETDLPPDGDSVKDESERKNNEEEEEEKKKNKRTTKKKPKNGLPSNSKIDSVDTDEGDEGDKEGTRKPRGKKVANDQKTATSNTSNSQQKHPVAEATKSVVAKPLERRSISEDRGGKKNSQNESMRRSSSEGKLSDGSRCQRLQKEWEKSGIASSSSTDKIEEEKNGVTSPQAVDRKTSPGQRGVSNGNPSERLTLDDFAGVSDEQGITSHRKVSIGRRRKKTVAHPTGRVAAEKQVAIEEPNGVPEEAESSCNENSWADKSNKPPRTMSSQAESHGSNVKTKLFEIRRDKDAAEDARRRLFAQAKLLHEEIFKLKEDRRNKWWEEYSDAKKEGIMLEEQQNAFRSELDSLHRRILVNTAKRQPPLVTGVKDEPSRRANFKMSVIRLRHEVEDLRRRVETMDIRVETETKLKSQAEKEVRQLRDEVGRKKANLSLTQSKIPHLKNLAHIPSDIIIRL